MGRVSDVAGIPSPSKTFFAAAAAGGIWKSTNNGVTWRPVFDNQRVVSMGMLAIAPSDTMQVWAGTGEPNSRNTISPGGGVYKSTDGGITWKLMGLEKTQSVGRIVVHPTNPNIVYVAALGAPWNANPERGLYKTEDGGATWQLVKFVSDKAGVVDVALDPSNPNVVWAASWQRVRGPYFLNSGGPGSALWKSTDAGKTWTEIKGGGFPETIKGRIGIAISLSNPSVMYTMVEADTLPNAKPDKTKPRAKSPTGLYRSADGGATWTRTSESNTRPFYYSQVRVHPKNPDRVYWSSTPVLVSNDGGKTPINATNGIHVDHHAMWIDPNDPDRMIVGDDGGVAISFDQGGTYVFANSFAIGQLYNVSYDFQIPYRVCGGLQDNGSWCGPSRRRGGPITNAMWFQVGGGDGFVTQQDPVNPNIIYAESQGGAISRLDYATGQSTFIVKPQYRPRYDMYEDSVLIERGDTMAKQTPAQAKRIADLRTRQRADSAALDLRFNWNTPYFISPHNPSTLYIGGNRVLKSTKRGDDLFAISPDLSTLDTMKIRVSTRTTGGITNDATGAETFCTIVSLNESPIRAGILFAGTDDGRVWLTKNDGGTWEELTSRFPGVPAGTYVSRIEPSPHDSTTFFVSFDNHRNGDYKPYVFMTTDFGKTFTSIAANLPTGGPDFVHVIRQDPVNKSLLFLGTDVGAYVSANMGQTWQRFMTGLPTVPVHDLRIHPRDRELIAATHGRGIWIADISALQQIDNKVLAEDAHLFTSPTAFQYGDPPVEGQSQGHLVFQAPSPPYGAVITYRLAARQQQVRIAIRRCVGRHGAGAERSRRGRHQPRRVGVRRKACRPPAAWRGAKARLGATDESHRVRARFARQGRRKSDDDRDAASARAHRRSHAARRDVSRPRRWRRRIRSAGPVESATRRASDCRRWTRRRWRRSARGRCATGCCATGRCGSKRSSARAGSECISNGHATFHNSWSARRRRVRSGLPANARLRRQPVRGVRRRWRRRRGDWRLSRRDDGRWEDASTTDSCGAKYAVASCHPERSSLSSRAKLTVIPSEARDLGRGRIDSPRPRSLVTSFLGMTTSF